MRQNLPNMPHFNINAHEDQIIPEDSPYQEQDDVHCKNHPPETLEPVETDELNFNFLFDPQKAQDRKYFVVNPGDTSAL